jgi:hypothetical protein
MPSTSSDVSAWAARAAHASTHPSQARSSRTIVAGLLQSSTMTTAVFCVSALAQGRTGRGWGGRDVSTRRSRLGCELGGYTTLTGGASGVSYTGGARTLVPVVAEEQVVPDREGLAGAPLADHLVEEVGAPAMPLAEEDDVLAREGLGAVRAPQDVRPQV